METRLKGYSATTMFLGQPGICHFTSLNLHIIPDWFPWGLPSRKFFIVLGELSCPHWENETGCWNNCFAQRFIGKILSHISFSLESMYLTALQVFKKFLSYSLELSNKVLFKFTCIGSLIISLEINLVISIIYTSRSNLIIRCLLNRNRHLLKIWGFRFYCPKISK